MNWNDPKPDLNVHNRPRRKSFNELLEELARRTNEEIIPVERWTFSTSSGHWTKEIP